MQRTSWARAALTVLVPPLLIAAAAGPAAAQAPARTTLTLAAQQPTTTGQVTATKATTSRLAKTDRTLLGRSDAAPVQVVVKLDYDSLATYRGGIAGLPATSPGATGRKLSGGDAERRYERRIQQLEEQVLGAIRSRVPEVKVGASLRTVYGGVALTVPANRVERILAVPGVTAVQRDTVRAPQTDASGAFIGADALAARNGGKANAGKGVIVGVLDTGVWPEHPSFADTGTLGAPPAKADGTPRACDFGDNPLTPATDVFACNHKLIGGQVFMDAYRAGHPAEPVTDARDVEGHGTHTASTAAGDIVASASVLGIDRGPVAGIAPGAWISAYKVCGFEGCFTSDSAQAIGQAVRDGVQVINFSVGGGQDPFTDAAELAFLDAFAAGVFVSASAGNDGPGAGTVEHRSPWVTTVAASTQLREFRSVITLTSTDGTSATFSGTSATAGVATPAPVTVVDCAGALPAGSLTGKVAVCAAVAPVVGNSYQALAAGAAGLILHGGSVAPRSHYVPTVQLTDGTALLAYLGAHPGVTATFTEGAKADGTADQVASFSSRGPAGLFLKPDVAAPGTQILAGMTPGSHVVLDGPGEHMFAFNQGTSMAAPHVAGSAAQLKALHPDWTPAQLKSALMTTATTAMTLPGSDAAAGPFDRGAGRIRVDVAANPGLTFDETAARMAALGNDPSTVSQLNLPSINAPVMPGLLKVQRTVKNVTDKTQLYTAQTTAPSGSSITVLPPALTVAAGATATFTVVIASTAAEAQYTGEVRLVPLRAGLPVLHLPVAFVPKQGALKVAQACAPATVTVLQTSTCTVTAENTSFTDTTVDLATFPPVNLPITGATGATVANPLKAERKGVALTGVRPGAPTSVAPDPGTLFGYLPLDAFGVAPTQIGDEQLINLNTPPFMFNGTSYTSLGVDANGYLVAGGGTPEDNNCCDLTQIPDPARPNNLIAPFWSDLDGGGAPGIFSAVLTDGVSSWIVVEWRVYVFGTNSLRRFQVWLGVNGVQDIQFAYDFSAIGAPFGQPFLIGAENADGTAGAALPRGTVPTTDLRVTSSGPQPGGTVSYTVTVKGIFRGNGQLTTTADSPLVAGTTVVTTPVTVR
ncbi:S8 family serine peptidase [Dactylosporangium siamense]|uniref:Peptidase S8 n=1 Tax=Dactylosporangium siamense TaxID=685454 RepID=A0A919UGK3_9ACTN|nr:S8 family serine peptidase [Dactylosporangium siamense]GIG49768.1 peptidase S8 [Dactylosporangium siamense]